MPSEISLHRGLVVLLMFIVTPAFVFALEG
jgi:hypothetical protein